MLFPEKRAMLSFAHFFVERVCQRIFLSLISHSRLAFCILSRRIYMKRRLAREIAIQSLYQMEMNEVEAEEAVVMLLTEASEENESQVELSDVNKTKEFVLELVNGVANNKLAIDELLVDYLQNWNLDRLSKVDRQILRLAVYEMVFRDDVPGKVAVNEAVDLAKHFGMPESGKFVNGVLGKLIGDLDELKSKIVK